MAPWNSIFPRAEKPAVSEPSGLAQSDAVHVDPLLRDGQLVEAVDYVNRRLPVEELGTEASLASSPRALWEAERPPSRSG